MNEWDKKLNKKMTNKFDIKLISHPMLILKHIIVTQKEVGYYGHTQNTFIDTHYQNTNIN